MMLRGVECVKNNERQLRCQWRGDHLLMSINDVFLCRSNANGLVLVLHSHIQRIISGYFLLVGYKKLLSASCEETLLMSVIGRKPFILDFFEFNYGVSTY